MSSTTPKICSLYRRLLRELPTPPTTTSSSTSHQKLSSPSPLQKRIRSHFTSPPPSTTTSQSTSTSKSQSQSTSNSNSDLGRETERLHQAEQFVQYVQAQRMYATLIERYNPGMGMSEEERVRLTARRVGMDLPDEFGVERKKEG
ncbi:hypothetical protein BCR34DRAFT_624127 [Clohesyomyces aquaticus]|uniref:Ras guanyl-nucleotide exchange factor RasGEF n=1 Tax=Clohesyomyces aquaticus TaxID=1231657 RepID=A0A1Y1ZRK3_9PLEO|nr:hypothetical protein BCR34DRAFT_624127 [Clohesyomyces aquaticus]